MHRPRGPRTILCLATLLALLASACGNGGGSTGAGDRPTSTGGATNPGGGSPSTGGIGTSGGAGNVAGNATGTGGTGGVSATGGTTTTGGTVGMINTGGSSYAEGEADYSMDVGWQFNKSDVSGGQATAFADNGSGWSQVSTPHTFNDVDSYRVLI